MSKPDNLGGIIHTYQKLRPRRVPQPDDAAAGPGVAGLRASAPLRQHAPPHRGGAGRAVHIDPSQIRGLGPSLESLMAMLRERKRKILETYETGQVQSEAHHDFHAQAAEVKPPAKLAQGVPRGRARRATARPRTTLVSRRRRAESVRAAASCTWPSARARNTRSMSWPPSTNSPAARR